MSILHAIYQKKTFLVFIFILPYLPVPTELPGEMRRKRSIIPHVVI